MYDIMNDKINMLELKSQMIPEEELREELAALINEISEACVNGDITQEQNNELIIKLREE